MRTVAGAAAKLAAQSFAIDGAGLTAITASSALVIQSDRLASRHSHPQVSSPVHPWRLLRKWLGEAEPSTETHPDLPDPLQKYEFGKLFVVE